MIMKHHILAAMREQLDAWETLIARYNEAQRLEATADGGMSLKDELAHLWAWQQRSIARMEAAIHGGVPQFPAWPNIESADAHTEPHAINAWITETQRDLPWDTIYQRWREQYLGLLSLAEQISEPHLLDSQRYDWMNGHPLILVLLASYDHHQEHREQRER